MYVGGSFVTAGGVTVNNIAKWNGSAWSALGSGTNNVVRALAPSGTDLYAGGDFTTADGANATRIAKWNGSAWSALGAGMDNRVSALVAFGADLYVGGFYTTAGGVSANRIAKWDGSAWSALGSGLNSYVNAMAISGANLYFGGGFSTAGGTSANRIARANLVETAPVVAFVNSPAGSTAGGTSVTIYGERFTGITGVTFGGVAATSVTVLDDTRITATTPARTAGRVNVLVTGPEGTGTGTNLFQYASVSSTTSTSNDGLNDAAKVQLAALGFDPTVNQTAKVNAFLASSVLFTQLQLNASRTAGQNDVISTPVTYSLYNQTQYDSNRITGRNDVISSPGTYNLFNQTQFDANRLTGRNDVINSPGTYSLYTLGQIQNLNIGIPLIQKDAVTGKLKLTIGVQRTTNLATTPFTDFPMSGAGVSATINGAGKLEFEFPATENAEFFRLRAQ